MILLAAIYKLYRFKIYYMTAYFIEFVLNEALFQLKKSFGSIIFNI